jgi:outer membrane receptor for ferrienterochelin and colicins
LFTFFAKYCNRYLTTFAIAVANVVFYAHAQQNDSLAIQNDLDDVVITGQFGQGSISKSVHKVKVIDAKRMKLQGAVNITQVLQNELNIRLYNDPVLGTSMSMQGLGGQNIKILLDGVPVIGREGGSIDLNHLNVNQIERIELVEGPMSVNFGTDALGGVINIITKKRNAEQSYTTLQSYTETVGQYNLGISNTIALVNGWSMDMNTARNYFSGFNIDPNTRFMLWKPREQYFGDFNIGRNFKRATLRFQNNFFDEKVTNRDSGIITPWFAAATDQYYFSRRSTSTLLFTHKITSKYTFDWVGSASFYRRIRNSYRKDLVTLEEVLIPSKDMNDTAFNQLWMSRGTFSSNYNQAFNYQIGYETNHEVFEGNRIREQKQAMDDYSIFASAEWKATSRLMLRPGVRFIYNTLYTAPVVPSMNLKWDMSNKITLRASYGKGFRAPSLKELYLDFVDPSHNVQGNPNLKAELQDNLQLNTLVQWQQYNRVFRIEPSLFYNHVVNRIDLALMDARTLEARYFNISRFQSVGANLNTELKAPNYNVALGYAYTGLYNEFENQVQQLPMFFNNEVRFNFSYKFKSPEFTLSSFLKYNSKLQLYQYNVMTGDYQQGFINGFTLWDITLNKPFFSKKLNVTTGIKNILNVLNVGANMAGGVHAAQSNAANIAFGRTVFVSLQYNFNWKKSNNRE